MPTDHSLNSPNTRVSFRIAAEDLDPDKVSDTLKIEPDRTQLKGNFPQNDPSCFPRPEGVWVLRSKIRREEPLIAHLENLLAELEPKQIEIVDISKTASVDFFCSLFGQNGVYLPADILRRLSQLNAMLNVNVYPPDTNESDDMESSLDKTE
ncbi:MAG: DUF4279 domain-containing protein [Chloroflexota bacterium]|nr:DUF4279 domain-containing protein [Chloroflexota bacterium]